MNKKELSSKDLLLCFLYSPGVYNDYNEAIVGRTKLTKMMFLFEKQIYKQFFEDSINISLPEFEPYYFGPFSKTLFEDLSFFESIGMIVTEETDVPLSPADKVESEDYPDKEYDDWSEASFDEASPEEFEVKYLLSASGQKYVHDRVWGCFSDVQKKKLRDFKAQINKISLDALLRYVYNKYPEEAKKSVIADRYIKRADE